MGRAAIAQVTLAALLASGYGLAQEGKSLVSTRLEVTGLVDERAGLRHVKWPTRIDVRRVPE